MASHEPTPEPADVSDRTTAGGSWGEGASIDPVERIFADCLAGPEEQWSARLESAFREHPEHADELQDRIDALRRLGVLGAPDHAEAPPFPERLGDFHLVERLGAGGMGVVYRAEQESLGRQVALKLIRPEHLYFPGARERFRREVEAIAKLQHPGIVPVFCGGEEQGIPFFAMELIDGCSLADALVELQDTAPEDVSGAQLARIVERCGARAPDRPPATTLPPLFSGTWVQCCFRLAQQVALALEHAHRRGVVHRDVKPSNILLTPDGRALLLDFGLASTDDVTRLTRTGSQVGSVPYMSPEQLRGEGAPDSRTDVYSLGVTLYELLTLRLPYQGKTLEKTQHLILDGKPAPIRPRNRNVPWDAETVCLAAMDHDPARRYATAAALAQDLGNVLDLRPIQARRAGPGLRARRWMQRHPTLTMALALGFLLVIVAPLVFALRESRHSRELETRLAEIRQLADVKLLAELRSEAESFYPLGPELVSSMDAWLRTARSLDDRVTWHESAIERLQRDRTDDGQADEAAPRTASFAAWELEVMQELVADLVEFRAVIADTQRRRDFAATVEERSVTGADARRDWQDAMAAIEKSKDYGGLRIRPLLGLLPLGSDPQTGLWEFWHLETGERPVRDPSTGRWQMTAETGMVFVLLPGGEFSMGIWPPSEKHPLGTPYVDPWADTGHHYEGPVHPVRLDPFLLSRYEMTQGQWLRLTGENPSGQADGEVFHGKYRITLEHPVERVSYTEATQQLHRLAMSLPTEAQWEYACRAGSDTVYSFGNDPTAMARYGNVRAGEALEFGFSDSERWVDGFLLHGPVGSFLPNAFGLHDMHGNVAEWCRDYWRFYYDSTVRAGDGLREGDPVSHNRRVFRGGAFEDLASGATSGRRTHFDAETRSEFIGLRPARSIPR